MSNEVSFTVFPSQRFDNTGAWEASAKPLRTGLLVIVGACTLRSLAFEETADVNSSWSAYNCSTTDSFVILRPPDESQKGKEPEVMADVLIEGTRNDSNVSHLRNLPIPPKDWNEQYPKLKFPKTTLENRYKMATLHLDKGLFVFDFLRGVLSFVQPYDVPIDLLTDAIESRISVYKLISESVHVESAFLSLVGVCCILACIIPGTEVWLACRPIREDYKPSRHPSALAFLLAVFVLILGLCMVTMVICNIGVSNGIEKLPATVDSAFQDLNDYHTGTTSQLRKCLTRSLDVADEAILADLDNVEELLGKPVQAELSSETGLDVALDALLDIANGTQELSSKAESLLKEGERARDLGTQLSRETEEIRRELEAALRACTNQDRPLCATIDPSSLRLTLRMDRLLRDDRLLRLRDAKRENLTEATRQARGEYLYVPLHIARNTLDARNQIRREINDARARIFEEARVMEASSSEISKQLESVRSVTYRTMPYIIEFERTMWYVGLGIVLIILPVWILIASALFCHCGSSKSKVRPTLLCGVLTSCLVSIMLWATFILALALSSHTEMLVCRPLYDPNFRVMEALLESPAFHGKRLSVPLKELFEQCEQNEAAYPAFRLGDSMKLEQLTAHWTWSGLSKAMPKLKVDLKGLRILTPNLQQRLQNLLYACGLNLTEHRITIQGSTLNKDLAAFSDQLESVARQLNDRMTSRDLQIIGSKMRDISSQRFKALMKLQDELIYRLAVLELQVQPLLRQVNQSISHLKTIQYYIDNQGEMIAQLKTKSYVRRLQSYLDQWRTHVLSEMGSGVAKCRPIWEILKGLKLLLCHHILGPMDGFWFATIISIFLLMICTPIAHVLSLVYKKQRKIILRKNSSLLPARSESPDTVVIDRDTWQTPVPPPLPPDDGW
ncbi:prominin-1-like [Prorops nasuta]|uniref:prominin-1-like n=1 Tax=Prorops nasuta TaxID=863751 RepID=UPI0034CDC111